MTENRFRCPFEIKGENEGTIIHANLNDDRAMRFKLIRTAFEKFHTKRSTLSIKFHLPESLFQKCSSIEELKIQALPYQTEVLAAELDYRLDPFLPYQIRGKGKEELEALFKQMRYKFAAAHLLSNSMHSFGVPAKSVIDIAAWIQSVMIYGLLNGLGQMIRIKDDQGTVYLSISLGSATFHPEDYPQIMGEGNDCRNVFGIVTCPFYPESFGRYSKDIVIVMSRVKDFTELESKHRRNIRYKANSVHQQHGVVIKDLYEDKQPDGVWIPGGCSFFGSSKIPVGWDL